MVTLGGGGIVLFQNFKPPKRPFRRMNYTEAIEWLKEHDVKKDDGTYYEFGEVTARAVDFNLTTRYMVFSSQIQRHSI